MSDNQAGATGQQPERGAGDARSGGRWLTSLGLPLMALVLIGFVYAHWDLWWQQAESRWDDHNFDPSGEGLIVVDTPQLFTRERLINDRLDESAWIEDQLEKVDDMLAAKEFARVDTVSVTRQLLSTMEKDKTRTGDKDAAQAAAELEKLGKLAEGLGISQATPLQQFRDAKNYRERLSLQRYESILDDAHDIGSNTLHRLNFMMTLSPARRRSDSIAAVQITVREPRDSRLLFDHYGRLLIETRKRMERTVDKVLRDRMLILEQDFPMPPVEIELIDRVLMKKVMEADLVAAAQPGEDLQAHQRSVTRYIDRIVDRVVDQQRAQNEAAARAFLHDNVLSNIGIPVMTDFLMPGYPEQAPSYWHSGGQMTEFARLAPAAMIARCGVPTKVTALVPKYFAVNSDTYKALRQRHLDLLVGPNPADPQAPWRKGKAEPQNDEERAQLQAELEQRVANWKVQSQDAARSFERAMEVTFNYPCPPRDNQITRAKLRLIGRLELLARGGGAPFAACAPAAETRDRLVAYIGAQAPPDAERARIEGEMGAACPASDLPEATERLAERLSMTGGDYAEAGIVMVLEHQLTHLRIESSSRSITLGKFFVFDVTRCDLTSCTLRTRTKAEALTDAAEAQRMISTEAPVTPPVDPEKLADAATPPRETPASARLEAGPGQAGGAAAGTTAESYEQKLNRIRRAGREEAFRLFLELRCFAVARSYTVWPRAGERAASFDQDSKSTAALFDLGGMLGSIPGLGMGIDTDVITRREQDHIFGIGDLGLHRAQRMPAAAGDARRAGLLPCGRGLETFLDHYEPDGEFIKSQEGRDAKGFVTEHNRELKVDALGPEVELWWAKVLEEFDTWKLRNDCENKPQAACRLTLEVLMQIAQTFEPSNTHTKFAWLVAPRRETPRHASRHVPMSVPLSALISLPSWWGHAELEITTCWVRPRQLKERSAGGQLCGASENSAQDEKAVPEVAHPRRRSGSRQVARDPARWATRHTVTIPLPGKVQDVLQRIGFFIIRSPYLDATKNEVEEVEAGRSAKVRLTGNRLWKNPRVRLGNQWHDRLEVLPDMQGVIATFECIEPTMNPDKLSVRMYHEDLPRFGKVSAGTQNQDADCVDVADGGGYGARDGSSGSAPPRQCRRAAGAQQAQYVDERQAEIWTSEGRTSPAIIKVHAFRPRYFRNGEIERPCWLKKDTDTGMDLANTDTDGQKGTDEGTGDEGDGQ